MENKEVTEYRQPNNQNLLLITKLESLHNKHRNRQAGTHAHLKWYRGSSALRGWDITVSTSVTDNMELIAALRISREHPGFTMVLTWEHIVSGHVHIRDLVLNY
jgi:hypothetical protein